jgi:hypothetical protein
MWLALMALSGCESAAMPAGAAVWDLPELDIRPNVARVYGSPLGGKDNFKADRAKAERLLAVYPPIGHLVRDNRAFLTLRMPAGRRNERGPDRRRFHCLARPGQLCGGVSRDSGFGTGGGAGPRVHRSYGLRPHARASSGVLYWRGPSRALTGRRQRLEPRFPSALVSATARPDTGRVSQEPMRLAVAGQTERRRPG